MTITISTAQAINDLVTDDPTLVEELRNASTTHELMNKLLAAAQAHGITVDEASLNRELDLALSRYAKTGELSDKQLEGVSGGGVLFTCFAIIFGGGAALGGLGLAGGAAIGASVAIKSITK